MNLPFYKTPLYKRSPLRGLFFFILFTAITTAAFSQTVYRTPSGKKYHLATCRMVTNVSAQLSLTDAVSAGLQPCKICNPPLPSGAKTLTNTPRGTSQTVQCRGYTKAGTRCKHLTTMANGYCFQHNPDKKH